MDGSKSTKGASKLRRDLINAEIARLRELLPLPLSTRHRLSQLQLMALICVFLRKMTYFNTAFTNSEATTIPIPNIGFSKALFGFIMMMTQGGKLLYVSENASEYLGHSMEDLLIHGDSVYDVVDKKDHLAIQSQLAKYTSESIFERRICLCRVNISRNTRRQLRFGDQKVLLVEGHYMPCIPLYNRKESVFVASCKPVILPETRESVVQGATNIFITIHSMDMKYLYIDRTAESHIEYTRSDVVGISWYHLLHWESIRTAQTKHQLVIHSVQDKSSTALLKLQSRTGRWFWIHCVLQVKNTLDDCANPVIVCTNQVLSDKEAEILRNCSWLYSSGNKFIRGVCPKNPVRALSKSFDEDGKCNNHLSKYYISPKEKEIMKINYVWNTHKVINNSENCRVPFYATISPLKAQIYHSLSNGNEYDISFKNFAENDTNRMLLQTSTLHYRSTMNFGAQNKTDMPRKKSVLISPHSWDSSTVCYQSNSYVQRPLDQTRQISTTNNNNVECSIYDLDQFNIETYAFSQKKHLVLRETKSIRVPKRDFNIDSQISLPHQGSSSGAFMSDCSLKIIPDRIEDEIHPYAVTQPILGTSIQNPETRKSLLNKEGPDDRHLSNIRFIAFHNS